MIELRVYHVGFFSIKLLEKKRWRLKKRLEVIMSGEEIVLSICLLPWLFSVSQRVVHCAESFFFSTFSTRLLVHEHEYFFKAPSFRQVDKNTFLAFLLTVCICFYPMTFPALVALKKLNYFSDESCVIVNMIKAVKVRVCFRLITVSLSCAIGRSCFNAVAAKFF